MDKSKIPNPKSNPLETMDQAKVLNVAIVGGGPGCKAIMDMMFAEKLSQLRIKLIGVACTNPKGTTPRRVESTPQRDA